MTALSLIDLPGELAHWTSFLRQSPAFFAAVGCAVIILANFPWPEKSPTATIQGDQDGWRIPAFFKAKPKPLPAPEKLIEIIPIWFEVLLNYQVPEVHVEFYIVNYTDTPIHIDYFKLTSLRVNMIPDLGGIIERHWEAKPRSVTLAQARNRLFEPLLSEVKKIQAQLQPYDANIYIDCEGHIGDRPFRELTSDRRIRGTFEGLNQTLVPNTSLVRRWTLRDPVPRPEVPWLQPGTQYLGSILTETLGGARTYVRIWEGNATGNGRHADVDRELLTDVGPWPRP